MSIRSLIPLALAVALTVAASAVGASAAKNPSALILVKKDFPAHADYEAGSGVEGFNLEPALAPKKLDDNLAGYLGATYSEKHGHLQIRGALITTSSAEEAKEAFGIALKARQKLWKTLGERFKPMTGAPALGDQQLVFLQKPTVVHTGAINAVVRKRSVVWLLEARLDRLPPPSVATILTDFKTYTAKQKARVGAG